MAELLGFVASGISVVQIAGQLVGCIQGLRAICRSVRDIPKDLPNTLEEPQILSEVFRQMECFNSRDVQKASRGLLQVSPMNCQAAAGTLETMSSNYSKTLRTECKGRPLHLLRASLKKPEMRELKGRPETARSSLHLAITCYQLCVIEISHPLHLLTRLEQCNNNIWYYYGKLL